MPYVVTAPLVIAKKTDGRFEHCYESFPLPKDTDPDQIALLLEDGFIAEVAGAHEAVEPVEPVQPVVLDEPARAGAGSSTEAWAAYADAKGVTYAQGAGRDEIIAAVDAAK